MEHKRGDSFLYVGPLPLNGANPDLTGWAFEADICAAPMGKKGAKIADLPCVLLVLPNVIQLGSNAATDDWPLGKAVVDIKCTSPGGTIKRTETVELTITERVTE